MRKGSIFIAMVLVAALVVYTVQPVQGQEFSHRACRVPGDVNIPICAFSFGYVAESQFDKYGESAFLEFDANWAFAYFWNVLAGGNVDLNARYTSIMFMDSAVLNLPEQAAILALNAGWTRHYADGTELQVRIVPGIYPDIGEIDFDVLLMPVSCVVMKPLMRGLSGIGGLEVRPAFEMKVMPIIGVRWLISDSMRLDACIPESRFVYLVDSRWRGYAGFDWRNTSFDLRGKIPDEREQITVEDFRLYGGVAYRTSEQVQFAAELGTAFGRSVQFDEKAGGMDNNVDVDPQIFVRFGVSSGF